MGLTAVDMFCGAGGLSVGIARAGFEVLGAVDKSPLAIETYQRNHPNTHVWRTDVHRADPLELARALDLGAGELDLLAGCPPCQGFSSMRTLRQGTNVSDSRNGLVARFGHWVEVLRPRALMMENVPGLAEDRRLKLLLGRLRKAGYDLHHGVIDAAAFNVPQRRRRFVLLGVRGAEVKPSTAVAGPRPTVRLAIGNLPRPEESNDPLHNHGEKRSERIRKLIRSIPADGHGLRTMGKESQLACHVRVNGFYDVYGRMAWDKPAPTITSGCINPSKGRFLHPEQHRAITLREAALLQDLPADYEVTLERGKYRAADLIGNALPAGFAEWQARTLAVSLS